ncbi:MAG: diaminopimelate decarboxylase [Firmicutes bacterium]|nr:diaminopimelate decarboxylase [Bacillota bacterium]
MGTEHILSIGGVSCRELAETYGTPLMIYDQAEIERKLTSFRKHFVSDKLQTEVAYASKAFTCKALLQLVKAAGCSLDVVSGGELHCARGAGFPMEKVFFHGNNKPPAELSLILENGVGTVVLDNEMEAALLVEMAAEKLKVIDVLLRINPGVEAHTHQYIITANPDSKFGIYIGERQRIVDLLKLVQSSKFVHFKGFHAHIGSQIFDSQAFLSEIRTLAEFSKSIETELDLPVPFISLGGGFGAYYTEEDQPIPVEEICSLLVNACEEEAEKNALSLQKIIIEPGRSIVAEAGSTLYTVGFCKSNANKNYVFVDGGMADNIRPALYQAKYRCDVVTKADAPKTLTATVAGKCCESGDILIENASLPAVEPGDLLLVYTTGAYGYSMASNYNRLPRPAVVFAKDGQAKLVIRRETFEDLEHLELGL